MALRIIHCPPVLQENFVLIKRPDTTGFVSSTSFTSVVVSPTTWVWVKTVQTLALLQSQKEKGDTGTTLLVMPTSLIYNWEMEASKFAPELKILTYTGTLRNKDINRFKNYDLVLTSYGITRLDVDSLKDFYFNYIILDESLVIKNPTSNIAKAG